jgi:hypothetical protein
LTRSFLRLRRRQLDHVHTCRQRQSKQKDRQQTELRRLRRAGAAKGPCYTPVKLSRSMDLEGSQQTERASVISGAPCSHLGSIRRSETVLLVWWGPSPMSSEGSVRVEGAMARSPSETAARHGSVAARSAAPNDWSFACVALSAATARSVERLLIEWPGVWKQTRRSPPAQPLAECSCVLEHASGLAGSGWGSAL